MITVGIITQDLSRFVSVLFTSIIHSVSLVQLEKRVRNLLYF